jgi:subfamily B ATP-binding cassette protein HlyB/CyaB
MVPHMHGIVSQHLDSGLRAACGIAAFYRIAADQAQVLHDLALKGRMSQAINIQRAAEIIGLKARVVAKVTEQRLRAMPVPKIVGGKGSEPREFGSKWFLPSIWCYRRPLAYGLLASLFVQRFALNKPLFFQVTVDKLLTHKVIRRYSCSSPASQSLVSSMSFSNI